MSYRTKSRQVNQVNQPVDPADTTMDRLFQEIARQTQDIHSACLPVLLVSHEGHSAWVPRDLRFFIYQLPISRVFKVVLRAPDRFDGVSLFTTASREAAFRWVEQVCSEIHRVDTEPVTVTREPGGVRVRLERTEEVPEC